MRELLTHRLDRHHHFKKPGIVLIDVLPLLIEHVWDRFELPVQRVDTGGQRIHALNPFFQQDLDILEFPLIGLAPYLHHFETFTEMAQCLLQAFDAHIVICRRRLLLIGFGRPAG